MTGGYATETTKEKKCNWLKCYGLECMHEADVHSVLHCLIKTTSIRFTLLCVLTFLENAGSQPLFQIFCNPFILYQIFFCNPFMKGLVDALVPPCGQI